MIAALTSQREKVFEACRDAVLCHAFDTHLGGRRPATIMTPGKGEVEWKPERAPGLARPMKIARMCLEASGVPRDVAEDIESTTLARMIVTPPLYGYSPLPGVTAEAAYNTSGMFQSILIDAQNAILRTSYAEGNTTFERWAKKGEPLADFKPGHSVIGGEVGDPKAIAEDGEFEETTLVDGKETFQLTVWGFRFSITWVALLNDRMSSFTEVPAKMVRAMKRKQNKLVYDVFKKNAKMADGIELFHASEVGSGGHGNKSTGAVSDYAAAFASMLAKMAVQKGLSPDSGALNLQPRHCLYSPALADKIGTLLKSMYVPGGTNSTTNIYTADQLGMLPTPDAELGSAFGGSDTAFYHVADSADVETVSYFHLQGFETPKIEMQASFDRLAIKQRVYHPFAVKALDFRGVQQHTGA